MISTESEEHVLSAITSILLTAVVCGYIMLQNPNAHWMSIGLGPCVIFLIYILSLRLIYIDQKHRGAADDESDSNMPVWLALVGYLAATAAIFFAANLLAPTADKIATVTGLGGTFVGSTFVALTTSLPELVTTAAAVRMGAFNMAVGNVVGSNNFNMAILFPVDIAYRDGPLLQRVSTAHVFTGAAVIVVSSIVVMGMVYRPKRRFLFIEPDAISVVLIGVSAIFVLYVISSSG